MYYTIQHFYEKDSKEIEKSVKKLIKGEIDAEDLSEEIQERVLRLGTDLLSEIYERLDDAIRESLTRKKHWNIEHRNKEKTILDVMGKVSFKRTGYYNKHTNEYVYLLDQLLGFEAGQKITLRSAAKALEETIDSSYRKGGKQASLTDEDHVAAQFQEKKGDLPRDSRGYKINTIMPKLICLYEDIVNESGEKSENPRYKLIGKKYFSGIYKGSRGNEELWTIVGKYINTVYDTEYLEQVYIAGDGAPWIKAGCEYIENSKFVLDKFHMMKYVNRSVTHLLDSDEEGKEEVWQALNRADKDALKAVYKRLLDVTEDENKTEDIKTALRYFLNNWDGIKVKVEDSGGCWKCCAEGQVSHILSSRMSSRPMGWSTYGCDQMAKLRAFKYNGGKVIDLLKYRKKKEKDEEKREEQEELIKELRKRKSGWSYEESTQVTIPGLEESSMKWMRSLIDIQVG